MSSIGTGYDFLTSTYSPDGRVFQVEYAHKAVDNSGTVVGLRVKDGVVFGVEKLIWENLWEPTANPRVFTVDRHIGMAAGGLLTDARDIVNHARGEAQQYRSFYQELVPNKVITERVANHVHYSTLFSGLRPLGASVIIGTYSKRDGPHMSMVEPSGLAFGYYGIAIGKAKTNANTSIERLDLANMTAREAVKEIAKIIYANHDDMKDKLFYLEMSWVCEETEGLHKMVPRHIVEDAEELAKKAIKDDAFDDDDDDEDEDEDEA